MVEDVTEMRRPALAGTPPGTTRTRGARPTTGADARSIIRLTDPELVLVIAVRPRGLAHGVGDYQLTG